MSLLLDAFEAKCLLVEIGAVAKRKRRAAKNFKLITDDRRAELRREADAFDQITTQLREAPRG